VTPLDLVGLVLGYFGVAATAIFFMYRIHVRAMDMLKQAYEDNRRDKELLVSYLQSHIVALEEKDKP
jgi:hypothetical protein